MELRAILFDVGGTIAETEELHRICFNEAFKEYGLSWYWDEAIYRELVFISGGKERIKHYIKRAWPEMLKHKNLTSYISALHKVKSQIFEEHLVDNKILLRPGIERLLKELKESEIRVALVSSTTEENLYNLFNKGLEVDPKQWFEVISHGDCTVEKKPSPDIYHWTLEKLKLPAEACIAIEDAPRGVNAAVGAGLKVIVTPSTYTQNEEFDNVKFVFSHLGEPNKSFKIIKGDLPGHSFVNLDLLNQIQKSP